MNMLSISVNVSKCKIPRDVTGGDVRESTILLTARSTYPLAFAYSKTLNSEAKARRAMRRADILILIMRRHFDSSHATSSENGTENGSEMKPMSNV